MRFLYENIFIRFGCPVRLVTDNAPAFKAGALVNMCESMGIQLLHSTSYYPRGNSLDESSNKTLVRIIRKLLENNQKIWDSKLKFALWVDRVTEKRSIGTSSFKLVYGTKAIFPIQLILPVAKFFQEEQDEPNEMVRRMLDLVELQQVREQMMERSEAHQKNIKILFDKRDTVRKDKGKHGRFDSLWIGPFMIAQV